MFVSRLQKFSMDTGREGAKHPYEYNEFDNNDEFYKNIKHLQSSLGRGRRGAQHPEHVEFDENRT